MSVNDVRSMFAMGVSLEQELVHHGGTSGNRAILKLEDLWLGNPQSLQVSTCEFLALPWESFATRRIPFSPVVRSVYWRGGHRCELFRCSPVFYWRTESAEYLSTNGVRCQTIIGPSHSVHPFDLIHTSSSSRPSPALQLKDATVLWVSCG